MGPPGIAAAQAGCWVVEMVMREADGDGQSDGRERGRQRGSALGSLSCSLFLFSPGQSTGCRDGGYQAAGRCVCMC